MKEETAENLIKSALKFADGCSVAFAFQGGEPLIAGLDYFKFFTETVDRYNKKNSEKYGLLVYLCHYCHNEPPKGVHFSKEEREKLQARVQKTAMKHYGWTTEDFIKIIGRNFVLDEGD
jgi:hypothetical protein